MNAVTLVVAAIALVAAVAAALGWQRAKKAEAELAHLSNYDRLTGLPNRQQLNRWLNKLLHDSRRSTARVAIIFLELNRFELLNDTYGHEVGDALMVAASKALRATVRDNDLLVRFGGPQFVVACPDIPDKQAAEKRAAAMIDALQRPYEIGQDRIRLAATAGITVTDQQYSSAEDVILDATVALDQATEEGSGTITTFDHSMRSHLTPSTAEHRLREALERGEFWLLYMPVVELENNKIVGVEALLRWADPDHGLVSPAVFLKSLDDTGLIVPVGQWVLREAARQTRVWSEQFPQLGTFETTINVSSRQLVQSDFVEAVVAGIEATGVDPTRMCLEITEGSLARDIENVWAMLRQLKTLGIKLALDDFGTGYSSLNYLRRFSIDNIKIDRTFVQGVDHSREDHAIVQQIIGLAHALGMRPVAEAVDTAEQVAKLKELGCDFAQGYYFSTPQPADVIERLLQKGTLDPEDRPQTLAEAAQATAASPTIVAPKLS